MNRCGFLSLPEEVVLKIGSFLNGCDIHHLGGCSKFFRTILDQDSVWKKLLLKDSYTISSHLEKLTEEYIQMFNLEEMNRKKLQYLLIYHLEKSWNSGQHSKIELPQCCDRETTSLLSPQSYVVNVSQELLSIFCFSSQQLRLWDLCSPQGGEGQLKEVSDKVLDIGTNVSKVLLLDSYFVILGKSDDAHLLDVSVYTLTNFKFLWKEKSAVKVDELARNISSDVVSFGNHVLIFRFHSLVLYEIKDSDLTVKSLNSPTSSPGGGIFQYPKFSANSENYFGIPFTLIGNIREQKKERATICCWNLSTLEEKVLTTEKYISMEGTGYGFFTDTAIHENLFYGLEASCGIIVWDIEDCIVLKVIPKANDSAAFWNPQRTDMAFINPFMDLKRMACDEGTVLANLEILIRYTRKNFGTFFKTDSQLIFTERFGVNVYQFSSSK